MDAATCVLYTLVRKKGGDGVLERGCSKWLYCVECPQYSIRFKAVRYLCTSCLLSE